MHSLLILEKRELKINQLNFELKEGNTKSEQKTQEGNYTLRE